MKDGETLVPGRAGDREFHREWSKYKGEEQRRTYCLLDDQKGSKGIVLCFLSSVLCHFSASVSVMALQEERAPNKTV